MTGCFSSALGFQLMKLSSTVEAGIPLYRAPRWLAGFFLLAVVQTLADAISLSFLPLSVVAPFAGLTICFTLLLASSGLFGEAEELSRVDLAGALCVLMGVACVSTFAPHPEEEQTVAELAAAATEFAVPLVLVLTAVAGCLGTAASGRNIHVLLAATGAASCGALSQTFLKLVSLEAKESIGGGSVFSDPTLLLSLSGLLFTAPSQLRLLTAALAVARASLAVPLYQSSLIAFTTSIGGIAFNEFAAMTSVGVVGYSGGLLLATAGLIMLSVSGEQDAAPDEDAIEAPSTIRIPKTINERTSELWDRISGRNSSRESVRDSPPAPGMGRNRRRSSMRIAVPLGFAVIEAQTVRQEVQLRDRSRTVASYTPPKLHADTKRARSQTLM